MKTSVYVDGFNLYYRALRRTPYKWVDPVRLATSLLPEDHYVGLLRYFTARVSAEKDPGAPARQLTYIKALQTLPEVHIHYGHFLTKKEWRPLTNLPVAGDPIHTPNPVTLPEGDHLVGSKMPRTLPVRSYRGRSKEPRENTGRKENQTPKALVAEFRTTEEKGSDVNLGTFLVNDAWKEEFDAAMVISNDTDLITPISMVSEERGKPVFVVCPRKGHMAHKLENVASHVRHIRVKHLKDAQFPDVLPSTGISKPDEWE